MSNDFGNIDFEDAIPRLVATYNHGKLVPFTGAGISAPSIPLWQEMVSKLCNQNSFPFPQEKILNAQQLIQFSESIVTKLTRESHDKFVSSIEQSLGYTDKTEPKPTAQCSSLLKLWWPLVITTNYDRMLVNEFNNIHLQRGRDALKVFGRNSTDCHSLLSVMSAGTSPAYWALQGYLGKSMNGKNLKDEIVMGYRQYRSTTYNNPTFRAVFGEVYRNHSFLFVGSGFSEDYFMGLFGEVLEKFGRNPHTHCALFSEKDAGNIDHKFLLTRLNIVAVFYSDKDEKYAGLSTALDRLERAIKSSSTKLWKLGYKYISFSALDQTHSPIELEIVAGSIPEEKEGECAVYSAGIDGNRILLSDTVETCIGKKNKGLFDHNKFTRFCNPSCWQYGDLNIFAAVARNDKGGHSSDARDLRMVQTAFSETISALYNKYRVINIMLLSAGSGKIFPPVHSLIAMLRGYREAVVYNKLPDFDKSRCIIKIHVVDPSVLAYIRRNPLEVEEIISCDDLRLNIEIHAENEIERFQIYLGGGQKLSKVSEFFSISKKFWNVRLEPLSYQNQQVSTDSEEQLWSLGLMPGSTIIYSKI